MTKQDLIDKLRKVGVAVSGDHSVKTLQAVLDLVNPPQQNRPVLPRAKRAPRPDNVGDRPVPQPNENEQIFKRIAGRAPKRDYDPEWEEVFNNNMNEAMQEKVEKMRTKVRQEKLQKKFDNVD